MAVVIAVTFKCVPLFRVTEVTYLVPSLGLVAVVIAVTFKCVPLFRVTKVTFLVPSKDYL